MREAGHPRAGCTLLPVVEAMMGHETGAQDQMGRAVEEAERALAATYWSACDALKAAIDPATLTHVAWARAYLAELHEVALSIEADPAPWDEVRKLISMPD